MAKRTVVTMVSDLSPDEEATETVVFGIDGKTYEIDLTDEEAVELRRRLEVFVEHGRPRTRARRDNGEVKQIREWAKEQGIEIPARGRLPQNVVDQYQATKAS